MFNIKNIGGALQLHIECRIAATLRVSAVIIAKLIDEFIKVLELLPARRIYIDSKLWPQIARYHSKIFALIPEFARLSFINFSIHSLHRPFLYFVPLGTPI
nr:MAG TPA: hypothetical protein [Caudoviricetes sp.]